MSLYQGAVLIVIVLNAPNVVAGARRLDHIKQLLASQSGASQSEASQSGWRLIDSQKGCADNDDSPSVKSYKKIRAQDLEECKKMCLDHPNCVSLDFGEERSKVFWKKKICRLFSAACATPRTPNKQSWKMEEDVMQQRACSRWSDDMAWLGGEQKWLSTDRAGMEDILKNVFPPTCNGSITVKYAEKDVGYSESGGIGGWVSNRILKTMNNRYMMLMHSGVRFVGCGKSFMLQLQSRNWGWDEDGGEGTNPYAVGFSMPTTSPGNRQVWEGLKCKVPKAGIRDVGAGNIIYYRIADEKDVSPWARGEQDIVRINGADINQFVSGIVPYLSWWNVESRYTPESLWSSSGSLMRASMVCDTFAVWVLGQALAFVQAKGDLQGALGAGLVDGRVNINRAKITLTDHEIVTFGDLKDASHEKIGFLRLHHPQMKAMTTAFWEVYKGYSKCREIQKEEEKQKLLKREWWKKSKWSSGKMFGKYRCTDRVSNGMNAQDMVQTGLQRYFYLGTGNYARALDWNVKAETSYAKAYLLLDKETMTSSDAIQLPLGAPRAPFAEGSKANPCGEYCLWQHPVPPLPAGGYM